MLRRIVTAVGSGMGVGVGLGVALVATTAARSGSIRPILRGAVRGVLAVGEEGSRAVAGVREAAEDLYHEARAERAADQGARDRSGAAAESESEAAADGLAVIIPRPQ